MCSKVQNRGSREGYYARVNFNSVLLTGVGVEAGFISRRGAERKRRSGKRGLVGF